MYEETINLIKENINPLSPLPSKRNKNFIVNVSGKDHNQIKFLDKIGYRKIQETYQIDN